MDLKRRVGPALRAIYDEVSASHGDEETAAALTCSLPILSYYRTKLDKCRAWLEQADDEWFQQTLAKLWEYRGEVDDRMSVPRTTIVKSIDTITSAYGPDIWEMLWHLYELLLQNLAARDRRQLGTFYTPPPIARYLVHSADRAVREHVGIQHGLIDPKLPGKILEPACGSGVFLAAAIKCCRADPHWRQSFAGDVVQRLVGIDLSRAALFVCRLRIAMLLRSSGIELTASFPQPTLWCGNALSGPKLIPPLRDPIAVVLGNPPFSYLSQNDEPWIQTLLRGDEQHAGYFEIDGESLGEKKTWLHDDYVKFLRLAQWCIEQNGHGVAAFVTNHGWLDNATFRIARQQLMRTFDRIEVVDLHGNAKRFEQPPAGATDENVFGIAQGIALATFTRSQSRSAASVARSDVWGSRDSKLERLTLACTGEPLPHSRFAPAAPWFAFVARQASIPRDYAQAPLLTELMPVNSTVPVTARDHFVVAATREALQQRLAEFCDSKISDEEIRRKYFQRTRSNRYESGDTRGWKLPAVRRTLMSEADPASYIRRCLYRPFVWRYVLWHPAMIDWPRSEITQHLVTGNNLALLARRQSIAGREANFFWITDCLPLDGVIRSDNRGSESFFPLRVDGEYNLDERIANEFIPEEFLAYCYALFHSRTYRARYASGLAMEFPRVLLPRERRLFDDLARLGQELIRSHLTDPHSQTARPKPLSALRIPNSAIENFHVGTYNVCRKWLQMEQQNRESPEFAGLQQLIGYTLQVQEQIEDAISDLGGFPNAFREASWKPDA